MPQPATSPGLLLSARRWYGWQAIGPGGLPAPWRVSPIFVETVTPLKTGQGLLRISAVVLLRPFVPRRMDLSLKVRWRHGRVMVVDWQAPGEPPCLALISEVDLGWIHQHCAAAVDQQDAQLTSVVGDDPAGAPAQAWLSRLFGATPEAMLAGAAAFRTRWPPWPKPPLRTGTVAADRRYRGIAAYRLLKGFVPLDPEDRWYIYHDGDHIVFQRVATGTPLWHARTTMVADEVIIHSLTVLLDRRHYGYGSPDDELARFDFVVGLLLTGEQATSTGYDNTTPRRAATAWRSYALQQAGKLA